MTTLKRRKPATKTVDKPWPSMTITPRVTREGQVAQHAAGPTAALWEETLGRYAEAAGVTDDRDLSNAILGEVQGLVVALSVLTCRSMESIYAELVERSR